MNLATLGTRGTDVVIAGLKLPPRFSRAELIESYGKIRCERDGTLPQHWSQGISNEVQRLSSDCSRFHKEHRQLDLIACFGPGQYCFREEIRPKLIDAANMRADLLVTQNRLVVPLAGETVVNANVNHLIGAYAQQRIVAHMKRGGAEIVEDSSSHRAYDFMFREPGRTKTFQIMECKGTHRAEGNVSFTQNEIDVMLENPDIYWLGIVYSIDIANGNPTGGELSITQPPLRKRWQFPPIVRLRRRPELSDSPFRGLEI